MPRQPEIPVLEQVVDEPNVACAARYPREPTLEHARTREPQPAKREQTGNPNVTIRPGHSRPGDCNPQVPFIVALAMRVEGSGLDEPRTCGGAPNGDLSPTVAVEVSRDA